MDKNRTTVAALVVSAASLVGIAGYESYRGNAYLDSGNVATIGYGATAGVKLGDTTTPARALIRLHGDVSEHARAIQRCIKAPLFQYEFDAYLSLACNIGAGAFCNPAKPAAPPTLIDLINAQRYAEACARIREFNKYRNPKTGQLEPLRGLTNRRELEYRTCVGDAP
ncbi:lysozyme [Acidovorax sp. SUPP2522]|nr:glycoside hydrolase family protein [Acidovorax sp. GBBC 1281]WCM96544.1 glycoside hydrolase family protein [Acidovorax sp. GBBC 1281]GKT18677.1 lysozyme [Acidovorax sp. SUPP2522]